MFPQIAEGQLRGKDSTFRVSGRLSGWDSFNAIANFSKADFEAQVGTEFNLLSQTHGHSPVTLIGVRGSSAQKGDPTESFSLVFKGADWQDVNQDVYYVSHPALGYFHVLMAPVRESRKSSQLCYEAVVNRLV
ncbi:MAG: hypothetical protein H0U23_07925 [Blastocatellia bacterium]|nr:hypothetical protein [Blastocatellia bacterium]